MELVVSVFDERPHAFFKHLKYCKSSVLNTTFYVHDDGNRSHYLTTGTQGFKRVNAAWLRPPFGKSQKIPNKGDEALAYVTYIVDRYNTLPSRVAFVHAHVSAWHSGRLCDYLKRAAVSRKNFESFNRDNAKHHCVARDKVTEGSNDWAKRAFSNWQVWFDETPPSYIHYKCCAQFVASRDLIRRHSLQTWRKIHAKALAYEDRQPDKLPFEYLWPSILDNSSANTNCESKAETR